MQYDAITLDTNILRQNGYRLESGLLEQFSQFREGSAKFVLSEIVLKEAHAHMRKTAQDALNDFNKSIKESARNGLLKPNLIEQLKHIYQSANAAELAAEERLNMFLNMTGAERIRCNLAEIDELIGLYFTPEAPFEVSGKKKNEFPDAIALLSIERWAQTNDLKVLAITNDNGWINFANSSNWIDIEKDLASALENFQQHAEQAKNFVGSLLAEFDADQNLPLLQQIFRDTEIAVEELEVGGEADSSYDVEIDYVAIVFNDLIFENDGGEYDFTIVRVGKDRIVANIRVSIDARAETAIDLSFWDSIDKESVSMGSIYVGRDIDFGADILLTIEGDFINDPKNVDITDLELIGAIEHIDFGNVGFENENEVR